MKSVVWKLWVVSLLWAILIKWKIHTSSGKIPPFNDLKMDASSIKISGSTQTYYLYISKNVAQLYGLFLFPIIIRNIINEIGANVHIKMVNPLLRLTAVNIFLFSIRRRQPSLTTRVHYQKVKSLISIKCTFRIPQ